MLVHQRVIIMKITIKTPQNLAPPRAIPGDVFETVLEHLGGHTIASGDLR